jgi:MFS transporter, DHA2 family, multidrug resistance protein
MAGAISVGLTMPIAGRLADKYSPAILVSIGCVLAGVSLVMYGHLDPLSSWRMIIGPQVVRGVGLALMMSPLLAAALNAVPRHEIPMASGFLNVAQNVGASFGIALLNNYVTDAVHQHLVRGSAQLPTSSPQYWRFTQRLGQLVMHRTTGITETSQLKAAAAAATLTAQRAQVLAFQNGFTFAGIILLCALPLCLLLKTSTRSGPGPQPVAME